MELAKMVKLLDKIVCKKTKKTPQEHFSKDKLKNDFEIVLLALPTLIWYIAFCFIPLFGMIIAFKSYQLIPGKSFFYSLFHSEWVGFENFRFMFLNPQMKNIIFNTIGYNIVFLILDTVLPIAFAIGLSKLYSSKIAKFSQAASLLPHFLSWVAVSYFVFAFLSTDKGIINNLFGLTGADAIRWYQKISAWPVVIVITHIWKSVGYSAVIYKAFLSGINPDHYESALLDGAKPSQITRYIIIPHLVPVAITLLILNLGTLFTGSFGLFYQVTRNSASILGATETIDVYVYKALKESVNYGYSSAASLLQNVCGCVLMLFSNTVITKIDPERGLFR